MKKVKNSGEPRGFTLPEILAVLVSVTVLLLLAVPSYRHFQQQQSIRYITQALTHTINYARLQALLRYQTILISAKDQDWQNGWVITTYPDKKILRDFPAMPLEITLIILQQKYKYLKITPQGTTEGYTGHFEYGDTSLVFNRGGRTYTQKTSI